MSEPATEHDPDRVSSHALPETSRPNDPPPREAERLSEYAVRADRLNVDDEERVVRGVAIVGCVSRNGYRYPAEVLREAAGLYEDKPVFLDHAADPAKPHARSARDLVGTLCDVTFEDAGDGPDVRLRGSVRVLDTESGRTFLALCRENGPGVGMSHVVLARRSADGETVESIEQVVSVDAVVFPATTTSLRESTNPSSGEDHLRLSDGWPEERDDLRRRLKTAEAALRRERLLAESNLPAAVVSETFRESVRSAADEEAARRVIEDRRQLVARTGFGPLSAERELASVSSEEAFLRAIKRG